VPETGDTAPCGLKTRDRATEADATNLTLPSLSIQSIHANPLLLPLFAITALLCAGHCAGMLLVTGTLRRNWLPTWLLRWGYAPDSRGHGLFRARADAQWRHRDRRWWLPLLALGGGILAVFSFAGDFSARGFGLAAILAGLAALGLGGWTLEQGAPNARSAASGAGLVPGRARLSAAGNAGEFS
jgi:hypothetical protein